MILEYFFGKILDECIDYTKKILKETNSSLKSSSNDVVDSIAFHTNYIKNWSQQISFSDLKQNRFTASNYIPLDIYLYPRRTRTAQCEKIDLISIDELPNAEMNHIILLGLPGAGKTTSSKYISYKLLTDENFCRDKYNFPIVIKLREFDPNINLNKIDNTENKRVFSVILIRLLEIIGLNINFQQQLFNEENNSLLKGLITKIVVKFLDSSKALLIIDGFDELNINYNRIAIEEIRELCLHLNNAGVIVTSRTGEFNYHIENAMHYEICELNDNQIKDFASQWLGDKATDFLCEINKSTFKDSIKKPLTIAHLCAIYEKSGKVPDKPKTIYKKIVNLLLEEWDEQRSVSRGSRFANFEIDRKFDFLCRLSYELTVNFQTFVYSDDQFISIYEKIYEDYDLIKREATKVIDEIESHNGLFIQSSYGSYEFAHKSIQEYLSAEYIVKLPRITNKIYDLSKLPNELAVTVAISSNSSRYFCDLIFNIFHSNIFSLQFYTTFLTRLIQEKPDFNSSNNVVLALCAAYSLVACAENNDIKISGKELDLLGKLENVIIEKNPFNHISKFYRLNEIPDKGDFVQLKALPIASKFKNYKLPPYLTLCKKLIEEKRKC